MHVDGAHPLRPRWTCLKWIRRRHCSAAATATVARAGLRYAGVVDLTAVGRLLIVAGIAVVLLGGFLALGGRLPFGRLPGDISIQGQNSGFFFPIVSCIVLSVVLTVVLNIVIRR